MDFDTALFKEIKEHSEYIVSAFVARDEQNALTEDMYNGRWAGAADYKKKTGREAIISIDPRVKAQGIIRIMNAGEATFSMKEEKQGSKIVNADDIVKAAELTWKASSKVRGRPLQKDLITSGVLHAEYIITIDCTTEMLAGLEEKIGKTDKNNESSLMRTLEIARDRMKTVADACPYVFDVINPSLAYTDRDKFGVRAFLRRMMVSYQELIEAFGQDAAELIKEQGSGSNKYETRYMLNDYYNLRYRQCYLDGYNKPVLQIEHELPLIPVVSHVVEGGGIFDAPEEQRQGFLYTIQKSGIWGMDNLALSVMFKNTFDYGATLKLKYRPGLETHADAQPKAKFDAEVPNITVPAGADLDEMNPRIIPDELLTMRALAEQKMTEGTIYSQTLGASLSGNPSYSLVAMLNQTGRQALVPYVNSCGFAMAEAVKKALQWEKHVKTQPGRGKYKVKYQQDSVELRAADIPDEFDIDGHLEMQLPQDRLGAAAIIAQLAVIPNLPISLEWMVEELMGIENVAEQRQKRWTEQSSELDYQNYVREQEMQRQQAEAQKQQEAMMMQQQAQGIPGAEQGIPPELGMVPQGQGGPPLGMGAPPEQEQGGPPMMPPGMGGGA